MFMKLFTFLVKKEKDARIESDFTNDAQKGDMVLWRGSRSNIIAAGIELFTYSPYCHASIYDSDGWTIGAGAWGTGYEDLQKSENCDLFRYFDPTENEQTKVMIGARSRIGHAYSYEQGFAFPFISKNRLKKLALDDMHNCSEMASLCYKDAGITLIDIESGIESGTAPADIGRAKKLKYIGTYKAGKLYTRDESIRNQHSDELEGAKASVIAKIIIWLFKKWSKRDEFYKKMFDNNEYLAKKR